MTQGADARTIGFYDREAAGYADYAAPDAGGHWPGRLTARLAPGGRVLDFGCGSGWAAARFRGEGFAVTALDGSAGLAAEAGRRYGLAVAVMDFASFRPEDHAPFDGVWCSFSLLHAPRAAMPGHLDRLARALRPGGTLYLGLKAGTGEGRDRHGRFYSYYGAGEITGLLADAGLAVIDQALEEGVGFDGLPSHGLHTLAGRNG